MQTKRTRLAFLLTAVLGTLLVSGAVTAQKRDIDLSAQQVQGTGFLDAVERAKEAQERALEGTWRVMVTPPAGGPPPSRSYHTYQRGGGVIQSNLTEGSIPGQGTWARTGNNEFTFTLEKFLPVNPLNGQPGVFVFKVREVIQLDGDRYTGRGEGAFCNAAGEQCVSVGCAQTVGTRLRIEAPVCQ